MRGLKLACLYALCAPWDAGVSVLAVLLCALGARRPRFHRGVAWLDVNPDARVLRRWGYSTTFGHVVLLQPGLAGTEVEAHELVHVRQFEGAACALWLALAVGIVTRATLGDTRALVAVTLLGPWWSYFGASLAAWLRCERPYLDNHFERHARAEVRCNGCSLGRSD